MIGDQRCYGEVPASSAEGSGAGLESLWLIPPTLGENRTGVWAAPSQNIRQTRALHRERRGAKTVLMKRNLSSAGGRAFG
jgi:hypothetical protein